MNMNQMVLTLSKEEIEILKELMNEAENYSNNLPISKDDVFKGMLRFYRKAKLIEYHEQYKRDIPKYIANIAMNKIWIKRWMHDY